MTESDKTTDKFSEALGQLIEKIIKFIANPSCLSSEEAVEESAQYARDLADTGALTHQIATGYPGIGIFHSFRGVEPICVKKESYQCGGPGTIPPQYRDLPL